MSYPRRDPGAIPTPAHPPCKSAPRLAFAVVLVASTAGCVSSPQYPTTLGGRPGDGSVMAVQPSYPISARDAAEDASDRASQAGYPAYGAPPASAPQSQAYAPPPGAVAPAPEPDPTDGTPPPALRNDPVGSTDLPPPGAAPPPDAPQPGSSASPQAGGPYEETAAFDGGQVVFGLDAVRPSPLQLAAYRHRRHPTPAASSDAASGETAAQAAAKPVAADTPYQTVVRPGEKLSDVAERVHSSKDALTQLNGLEHPRHVKAGTVLKIPYRYSYQVQKGDTLYTIAHRFNQDPEAMAKLNGLKTSPTLQPGQSLDLPPTAEDTGKRDHAAAGGPSPIAAPDKLADAALRKEERHGRRRRGGSTQADETPSATQTAQAAPGDAEPGDAHLTRAERRRLAREAKAQAASSPEAPAADTTAQAEPLPAHLTRAERRRLAREAKAAQAPAASTLDQTAQADAPLPHLTGAERRRLAREDATSHLAAATPLYTPAPAPLAIPSAIAPGVAATTPASSASAATARAYASTSAPSPVRRASPAAASAGTYAATGATSSQPYYAGVRPSTASASSYRAAAGGAAASSTYATPDYSARAGSAASTGSSSTRVANLTQPSYSPAYPAGGYAPSLGRARPVAPSTSASVAGLTPSEIASAGRGRFIWPLRGAVISGFGDKGAGQHNDGVDIAATPGAGVRAAAAGEVVYAGSSIPGFGNLVLVKHSGGWVTAYAHLDRIEVRMRDSVSQGEEIGQAGQTGAVDRSELHFEMRYAPEPTEKARPVDPTLVLPAG